MVEQMIRKLAENAGINFTGDGCMATRVIDFNDTAETGFNSTFNTAAPPLSQPCSARERR